MNGHLNQKPVIFLAFANDRVDNVAYLRNLPKELRGIREELEKAQKAGLCEVIERANAAIEDIVKVFQDEAYKNRIAIFHYGGHANSYQLLLESLSGGHSPAHREGLVAFLARREGLKFIFLNGCSTQQHAIELKQAGIPAVVGTSQSIHDEVATNLSIRFYSGMAKGSTIENAWLDAEDYIKTKKGAAKFRDLYWHGKKETENRFPWEIHYKDGAEIVKEWNLPEAAMDPLFGIPEVPASKLPDKPFLLLNRYEKKHAQIFFGRSYYIQKLYDRITDKKSPPIILLYGQSGVGKSSLLDAGVLPRLEKSHIVGYARRDREMGLLGTVENVLDGMNKKGLTIAERWKLIESETGKPLIIILDQAEEVYTKPNQKMPNELEDFLEALKSIFDNPAQYPGGKLILSYRKEYHPEIDEKFKYHQLDRTELFMKPLNREDIIDVVTGLTRTKQLRDKYNIEVEEKLPVIIADDLLEDKNTPVAPVLQIILTKMWDISKKDDFSNAREFSVEKYQALRKQGVLLKDFLLQEIEKIRKWNAEVVDSGLALDVLKYHTTDMGTACARGRDSLHGSYHHRLDVLDEMTEKMKLSYLLVDTQRKYETSLAHDTLALVVIDEHNSSDKPGQRATRILDAKIEEFIRDSDKISLDDTDLEILEHGKDGMRVLDNDKKKLLEISRQRKRQSEKGRKRKKKVAAALITMIIIASIVAFWQWNTAKANLVKSKANSLAVLAKEKVKEDPTIALRIAEKAWKLDRNKTVTGTIYRIYFENNFYKIIAKQNNVRSVAFSPGRKTILTGSGDKIARLWDLRGNLVQEFKGHSESVYSVAFSPGGKSILTGSWDKTARLWDPRGNLVQEFNGHTSGVFSVVFSPDGKTILTGSGDYTARLWDLRGNPVQEFKGHKFYVTSVAFSPDGKTILTGSGHTGRLWDLRGNLVQEFKGHNAIVFPVAFSPDGKTILTGSDDSTARLWDLRGNQVQEFKGHKSAVRSVAFSPDGKTILTGSMDNTARLWDWQGNLIHEYKGHTGFVTSVAFSPDGKTILTGSEDKTVRLWDLQENLVQEFKGHKSVVRSVAFSPDGKAILTGSWDKTARLWDLRGNLVQEFKGHKFDVSFVAFSPDGKTILTGSEDSTARLWDLRGNLIHEYKGHTGFVTSVAFSPDGKTILTGSGDRTARLWDLRGNPVQEFKGHKSAVWSVAFSPDGKTILTGSRDGTVRLWDLRGNLVQEFKGHKSTVRSVAFSPDGKTILTGSRDGTARLWDLRGNLVQEFKGHKSAVWSVAFSPDGKTILTGSGDRTARLWDLRGNPVQEFKGHTNLVTSVAFSPDGKTILTGSYNSTARLWKIISLEEFLKKGNFEQLSEEQKKEYGIED